VTKKDSKPEDLKKMNIPLSGTDSIASIALTGRTKDSDPAEPELETRNMT